MLLDCLFVFCACTIGNWNKKKQCSMTLKQQKPLKMLTQWQTVKKIESDQNI